MYQVFTRGQTQTRAAIDPQTDGFEESLSCDELLIALTGWDRSSCILEAIAAEASKVGFLLSRQGCHFSRNSHFLFLKENFPAFLLSNLFCALVQSYTILAYSYTYPDCSHYPTSIKIFLFGII